MRATPAGIATVFTPAQWANASDPIAATGRPSTAAGIATFASDPAYVASTSASPLVVHVKSPATAVAAHVSPAPIHRPTLRIENVPLMPGMMP